MLNGHHKSYNVHALLRLSKSIDTPMAAIGVGDGETLAPITNQLKYPTVLKPVQEPDALTNSYEYTQIDGFSDPISIDNFPKDNGLGSVIGGWGY